MLLDLPVIREAFTRTVRLVTTARLRDSVLLGLVRKEDIEALAEIEGATSNRRLAESRGAGDLTPFELVHGVPHAAFINASFAYAKPREPGRFNGVDRGAWYTAQELETSFAEVKFHMTEFLSRTGEYKDLRQNPDHKCLQPEKATAYALGNAIADAARARGLNGIIYPSVRRPGGTCFAVLFPHAVQSVAQGDVYRLAWRGSPEPTIEKAS